MMLNNPVLLYAVSKRVCYNRYVKRYKIGLRKWVLPLKIHIYIIDKDQ